MPQKRELSNYTASHKKRANKLLSISLPNINRFSKFSHWRTPWEICNNAIIKYLTTP